MIKPPKKAPPVSLVLGAELLAELDAEMWERRERNRSAMIRRLIAEGLHRAKGRRAKGQPVELTEKGT